MGTVPFLGFKSERNSATEDWTRKYQGHTPAPYPLCHQDSPHVIWVGKLGKKNIQFIIPCEFFEDLVAARLNLNLKFNS